MRTTKLKHEFVEVIPAELAEGTLYISIEYATATHKCCCGCGLEVVTPISPTDWKLTFDGESISLAPSIGNWGFDCRSHYWIRRNKVVEAPAWTLAEVEAGREFDRRAKEDHAAEREARDEAAPGGTDARPPTNDEEVGVFRRAWRKLKEWGQ